MITLCFVCPRCGCENNPAGGARWIHSPARSVLHLKTIPCADCIALQEWARAVLRRRGLWIDPDADGLPPPPQSMVNWDDMRGEWR